MKKSEKIWDAWESVTNKEKEEALKEFSSIASSGLYARLWLSLDPQAEKKIWVTEAASVNDNINGYDDAEIILKAQWEKTQTVETNEEDLIEYIENEVIYNKGKNQEWDRE